MTATGNAQTRLIIIRGNSGSGKSTLARRIREVRPRGVAIIGQDPLRRELLHVHDGPGCLAAGLIDLTARYALDHGLHAVVEGILYADIYGAMLAQLAADHRGSTHAYRYDLTLDATLQRHRTKPLAQEVSEAWVASWYRADDAVPALAEVVLTEAWSLDDALQRVLLDAGWADHACT